MSRKDIESRKRVPIFDWHEESASKISDFAGWEMPIRYSKTKKEHLTVRNDVGIFDISHMGEIYFKGEDALDFLQYTTTNDISKPPAISATYTLVTNERGAIKDEGLLYNMGDGYMLVCDSVAYEKLLAWFENIKKVVEELSGEELDLEIINKTYEINLFSIQGPKASLLADKLFDIDINDLWWFQGAEVRYDGIKFILSHSGYTGENGFEIFLEDKNPYHPQSDKRAKPEKAFKIWKNIIEGGEEYGIKPCGLATRDSTRIEAGYTLYGNESQEKQILSKKVDEVTPFQVNMGDFVDFDKDFFGKEALEIQKEDVSSRMIHLEMEERGIPREGYQIYFDDKKVGEITSGTMSPLLEKGIGIGFVDNSDFEVGEEVYVNIRGRKRKAVIVEPPFYDQEKYGAG